MVDTEHSIVSRETMKRSVLILTDAPPTDANRPGLLFPMQVPADLEEEAPRRGAAAGAGSPAPSLFLSLDSRDQASLDSCHRSVPVGRASLHRAAGRCPRCS
jgi:hypothetical protein